jgi:hypothetical protein
VFEPQAHGRETFQAMPQQRRGGHDDVRAHEQALDDLDIRLDTAAGRERTREAA